MSLLLFLSIGCSNLQPRDWAGGGARYASGYASDPSDTAGGDTAGGDNPNAPVLLDANTAAYVENDVGQIYISAGVAYEDDPDDVPGGRLYYTLYDGTEEAEQGSRSCTEDTDADPNLSALVANGNLSFVVGPLDAQADHSLEVYVKDFTQNESNTITVAVTGG